jgi:cold shock CspA family protein
MTTLNRRKGRDPNLGFGMVPSTAENLSKDIAAARLVMASLSGDKDGAELLDAISRVKGLCNRCWKQDQPNWTLVWLALGLPNKTRLKWMGRDLNNYRIAIKGDEIADAIIISERLERAGLFTCLAYFVGDDEPPSSEGTGFLYLLSTKEDRTLLKIGQTVRDVPTRVKEINKATGVVSPFGARHIWRVANAVEVESGVHRVLAEYRVRSDREFFKLDYLDAVNKIDGYLFSIGALERMSGVVTRILADKKYGFVTCDGLDFFFHSSEVRKPNFKELRAGDIVEFEKLDTTSGLAAADVRIAH